MKFYYFPIECEKNQIGFFWEYYHFLVDFCAFVASLCENETDDVYIFVPDFTPHSKFCINPRRYPYRNLEDHFRYIFDKKVNLIKCNEYDYEVIRSHEKTYERINWQQNIKISYQEIRSLRNIVENRLPVYNRCIRWAHRYVIVLRRRVPETVWNTKYANEFKDTKVKPHIYGGGRRNLSVSFFNSVSSKGGKTVELDEMEMSDQVKLFAGASVIIGQHGAGLSNIMFCSPGTKVVEINIDNSDGHLAFNTAFEQLAEICGLKYQKVLSEVELLENFEKIVYG